MFVARASNNNLVLSWIQYTYKPIRSDVARGYAW